MLFFFECPENWDFLQKYVLFFVQIWPEPKIHKIHGLCDRIPSFLPICMCCFRTAKSIEVLSRNMTDKTKHVELLMNVAMRRTRQNLFTVKFLSHIVNKINYECVEKKIYMNGNFIDETGFSSFIWVILIIFSLYHDWFAYT